MRDAARGLAGSSRCSVGPGVLGRWPLGHRPRLGHLRGHRPRLLREGWHVAINSVEGQREAAEGVAASADAPESRRAIATEAGVTRDGDFVRLFEATMRTSAPFDVLVNAADISEMVAHAQLQAHAARCVVAGRACWPADDGERRGALVRHQRQCPVRHPPTGAPELRARTHARYALLNSRARAALLQQRTLTQLAGDFVFLDPRYGTPWIEERAFRRSYWAPALSALGLRYRRPYNTRHSYAAMMLMSGMTAAFCATQLGHSVGMLLSTYARGWTESTTQWRWPVSRRRSAATHPRICPRKGVSDA